jgi:hypothetical protein
MPGAVRRLEQARIGRSYEVPAQGVEVGGKDVRSRGYNPSVNANAPLAREPHFCIFPRTSLGGNWGYPEVHV